MNTIFILRISIIHQANALFVELHNETKQKYVGKHINLAENIFQEVDHRSTFMKMFKRRAMQFQVPMMRDIKS
jgi:hypothetical protein